MTRHRRPAAPARRFSPGVLVLAVAVPAIVALVASLLPFLLGSSDDDPLLVTDPEPYALSTVDDGLEQAPELPRSLLDNSRPTPSSSAPASTTGRRGTGGAATAPSAGTSALFGGAGSPWGQLLAAGAALDPNSAAMVGGLSGEKFVMSTKQWTVPVYYADASTPRRDVSITSGWGPSTLRNVPIPAAAEPDPAEDAHLSIVDRSTGCVYDFWGAKGGSGGLSASWGNAIPVDSSGIYPGGMGSRGSGFSAAAGIVTADELRRGVINHALVFAYPKTRSGGPVAPATKSDGRTGGSDAIPEGARVRLDPSINLASLGLSKSELAIATAMQKYGMILGDTSGGFTIYAQNPISVAAPGFAGLLPDETWVDLSKIPTHKLQVMKLPAQSSNDSKVVGNRCNGW